MLDGHVSVTTDGTLCVEKLSMSFSGALTLSSSEKGTPIWRHLYLEMHFCVAFFMY